LVATFETIEPRENRKTEVTAEPPDPVTIVRHPRLSVPIVYELPAELIVRGVASVVLPETRLKSSTPTMVAMCPAPSALKTPPNAIAPSESNPDIVNAYWPFKTPRLPPVGQGALAGLIVIVRLAVAVALLESVTVTVKVDGPVTVGVPVIAPAELRFKPLGRVPTVTVHV
jgi:hypothetical protein